MNEIAIAIAEHESKYHAPKPKRTNTVKTKVAFDFEKRTFNNISESDLQAWKETYPAVDILLAMKGAVEWLISNPTKTKSNYRRFLTNWFSRAQEKGGNKSTKPAYDPEATAAEAIAMLEEQENEQAR